MSQFRILCLVMSISYIIFSKDFIYLFIYLFIYSERKEGREKERERNMDVREKHSLVASCTHPDQEPNLQPRHEPWRAIKPATFHFTGRCPTDWAMLVKAFLIPFNIICKKSQINNFSKKDLNYVPFTEQWRIFHEILQIKVLFMFKQKQIFCDFHSIFIKL